MHSITLPPVKFGNKHIIFSNYLRRLIRELKDLFDLQFLGCGKEMIEDKIRNLQLDFKIENGEIETGRFILGEVAFYMIQHMRREDGIKDCFTLFPLELENISIHLTAKQQRISLENGLISSVLLNQQGC